MGASEFSDPTRRWRIAQVAIPNANSVVDAIAALQTLANVPARADRCALRNVTGKLPERHHAEVKTRWWKTFDQARSAGEARQQLQALVGEYQAAYPSAMAVIERDLDALLTHLRFPTEHRKRIRTTASC